ncbi:MAG: DUF6231 family protein [Burkholderiales bacterium]|nr:DUF6231 family protein [Burkholderiales bacterium]
MPNDSTAGPRSDSPPDVAALLSACRPRTLLLLGIAEGVRPPADCVVTHCPAGEVGGALDGAARFDVVFVRGVLEALNKVEGLRLLCRLRDFHTSRLYVWVRLDAWEENDLFGLGMERLAVWQEEGQAHALFRFDIATYKPAPEWFNAKYWAHPELWDKYPWLPS